MSNTVKRKKSWLLRVELVAFVCVACFSFLRPIIADTHIAKTGVLRKILRLSRGEAPPEDGTVDGYQGQEYSKCKVEPGAEPFDEHLDKLNKCGDHCNKDDELQENEIKGNEHEMKDRKIEHDGHGQDKCNSDSQSHRGSNLA